MYIFIKKVRVKGRTYHYLVIEQYDLVSKRKRVLLHLSLKKILEAFKNGTWNRSVVRGVGFEPTQAYAIGSSARPYTRFSLELKLSVEEDTLRKEFYNWCLEHASERICKGYISYIRKPLNSENRWSITAYKRFYKFLCEKGDKKACEEFSRLKSKRSGSDLWVPPDNVIRNALGSPLGWLYSLLIQSGLRYIEVIRILGEADKLQWHDGKGFYRVLLDWKRGSKRTFWGYFLERVESKPVSPDRLQDMRQALGLPGFKYMRKWAATKMYEVGCGEAEVDFIQGRTPTSILRRHYLMIIGKADECYRKYAEWLRRFLSG